MSEHVWGDELERVFCRFGHCNVRLKREGYGFVVFYFPLDAEKGLRALKGRNICGEPLTLTWFSKQPKSHFPKFARDGRSTYELQRGRNPNRLGYKRRKQGFSGWRDHKMGIVGRGKSADVLDEERGYHQDEFKDYEGEEKDHEGDFLDEGSGVIPNQEDIGRLVEPTQESPINYGNGNGIEFDHYEPYYGYDKKHDNEYYHVDCSGGSRAENSQENVAKHRLVNKP